MSGKRTIVRLMLLAAAGGALVAAAIVGPTLWRNRDNLGRSWNCRRFVTEAPANLRALHRAQVAFREEHGHFTTDLVMLGFEPKPGTVRSVFYVYGFETPYSGALAPGEDPSRSVRDGIKAFGHDGDLPSVSSTATEDRFLAVAVASHLHGAEPDVWTIDERARLRRVSNGCWK